MSSRVVVFSRKVAFLAARAVFASFAFVMRIHVRVNSRADEANWAGLQSNQARIYGQ